MNCKKGFQSFYGWLALIPNPIIQTNEAWFLTNTEKIHALFCKLCEVIDTVNSYQELMKKLADILDDFDETVREELIKYIKELYDSGELSEMIGKIIAESIVPAQCNLDPRHIARVLHYAHYWEAQGYGDETFDIERYSYAQGNACFIADNGIKYWVVAYVCQNGSHFQYNDKAMLYVYRVNDPSTYDVQTGDPMTYVSNVLVSAVGHCNGLCYHKGYIYITPNSYATTSGQVTAGLTKDVIRFKFNAENGTIDPSGERATPTILSNTYEWTDNICSDGDELYFTDGYLNIYKYDFENNNAELVHSKIGGKYMWRPGNGMCISKDYIYVLTPEQRLLRYNRRIETIDLCYQIPSKCNDHMFKTGEIEGLSIVGDDIYMGSCYNLGQNVYSNGVAVTRFLTQNLKTNGALATQEYRSDKNELSNYAYITNWTSGVTNNISLYVSGDIPKDTDNPKNPFGIVLTDAFNCVQDCLDFIEGNDWIKRANIIVNQRLNQIPIDVKTLKPIQISGTYYKNNNSGTLPIVGHISALASNIYVSDLCVRCLYADDVIKHLNNQTGNDNVLWLYRCNAVISGLYCPGGDVSQHSKVTTMITATGSFVNFANPVTTEQQWTSNRGTYINASVGTVNAHGNVHTNQNIIA